MPWTLLASARSQDGVELCVYGDGGERMIRADGWELMSTRAHHSEQRLAELACSGLANAEPSVLIGGLGLGFTLCAALALLPATAEAHVAEIEPAFDTWSRGVLSGLLAAPLADARVQLHAIDVAALVVEPERWDAILLDVDNGPGCLSHAHNAALYQPRMLSTLARALRPGGRLAVWSAEPDGEFEQRCRATGLAVQRHLLAARGRADDPRHTLWLVHRAEEETP